MAAFIAHPLPSAAAHSVARATARRPPVAVAKPPTRSPPSRSGASGSSEARRALDAYAKWLDGAEGRPYVQNGGRAVYASAYGGIFSMLDEEET